MYNNKRFHSYRQETEGVIQVEKAESIKQFLRRNYVFLIAALVIVAWHTQMGLNLDSTWFSIQLDEKSYLEFLTERYQGWSSRLLIEMGLLFFTNHMILWRILDVIIWVFLLYGVTKLINDNYSARFAMVICLFFSCYLLKDMNSAGWTATINNYLWPLAFLVGFLLALKKVVLEQEIKWQAGIAGVVSIFFSCNHEQAAAAALGSAICALIYMVWKKVRISKWMWVYLAAILANLVFILTCPGNVVRKEIEISAYFKDFEELTLWNKLDMGITPVCNYSVFRNNAIFLIFLALLCIAVWKMQVAAWKRFLALMPLIGTLAAVYLLDFVAIVFPGAANMRNPVSGKGTYEPGALWSVAAIGFYMLLIAGVLWEIYLVWRGDAVSGMFLFAVLGIGFGTGFMMCLAPSIWLSGPRTYLYWQAALTIAAGYLWNWHMGKADKKKLIIPILLLALHVFRLNTIYIFWTQYL